jgi:hypothetical protein
MDWKITSVDEYTDIDEHGRIIRGKRVRYTVNGGHHTLRISMPDFDKGKAREIVEKEAAKVAEIYSRFKK